MPQFDRIHFQIRAIPIHRRKMSMMRAPTGMTLLENFHIENLPSGYKLPKKRRRTKKGIRVVIRMLEIRQSC